ncbi:MAG TPA: Hsp20/alpha crystallin family protein [Candidatus Paceibacterota bacterium]|nr:Hsp20/alpha crystallin family protein [Candidatus Paceibacterota bacterium]
MNLIRWQQPTFSTWPRFGRLSDLRNEIDRLFEAPLDELARSSQVLSGWTPALDIHENNENIVVRAELPGMKKEDMEISLHDGSLSISGERKADRKFENAEVYRSERFIGRFQRTIALPSPVSAERITAQYKDGILTITLPKTEDAKPKQINVQEG